MRSQTEIGREQAPKLLEQVQNKRRLHHYSIHGMWIEKTSGQENPHAGKRPSCGENSTGGRCSKASMTLNGRRFNHGLIQRAESRNRKDRNMAGQNHKE